MGDLRSILREEHPKGSFTEDIKRGSKGGPMSGSLWNHSYFVYCFFFLILFVSSFQIDRCQRHIQHFNAVLPKAS